MAREKGIVLKLEENKAQVGIQDAGGFCQTCTARLVCHSGASSAMRVVEIPRAPWMREGQEVFLHIPESIPVLASLIVFGLPIVFSVLGAFVGYLLNPQLSWSAPLGLVSGLGLSGLTIIGFNKIALKRGWFLPRALPPHSYHSFLEQYPGGETPANNERSLS